MFLQLEPRSIYGRGLQLSAMSGQCIGFVECPLLRALLCRSRLALVLYSRAATFHTPLASMSLVILVGLEASTRLSLIFADADGHGAYLQVLMPMILVTFAFLAWRACRRLSRGLSCPPSMTSCALYRLLQTYQSTATRAMWSGEPELCGAVNVAVLQPCRFAKLNLANPHRNYTA